MKKSVLTTLTFTLVTPCVALRAQSQVTEPLKLIQTIPLPGLQDGDFDHFQVNLPGRRLFLAAEDNSAVEVIDLRTNRLVHTIRVPTAPHSMAYDNQSTRLYVVESGPPSQVQIYDGTSYKLLRTIPMLPHADSSVYDSAKHLFYVGNGGKDAGENYCVISIIDTTSEKKVAEIRVDSDHIESMALEQSGPLMFVNMFSKNAVAVIDREKRVVVATWPIGNEAQGNGPMAFDEADHRLFVVTRNPPKVIVLDTDSGRVVSTMNCLGQDFSDDAVYDPGLKRLYVAGVPFADVFTRHSAHWYQMLGQAPEAFHAITAILVPQLNRYYVAVDHHGNTEAEVEVYQTVE